MRTRRATLGVVFVLLLVATITTALAEGAMTLTGCLAKADDGTFTLMEKGKTEKVKLHAMSGVDLGPHAGHTVRLTGEWQGEGAAKMFHVSKMEHVAASCS
jgi:hypothetical protein